MRRLPQMKSDRSRECRRADDEAIVRARAGYQMRGNRKPSACLTRWNTPVSQLLICKTQHMLFSYPSARMHRVSAMCAGQHTV